MDLTLLPNTISGAFLYNFLLAKEKCPFQNNLENTTWPALYYQHEYAVITYFPKEKEYYSIASSSIADLGDTDSSKTHFCSI